LGRVNTAFVEFDNFVEPEFFKGISKGMDEGNQNYLFQLGFQKTFNTNSQQKHLRRPGNLDIRTKVLAEIINWYKIENRDRTKWLVAAIGKVHPRSSAGTCAGLLKVFIKELGKGTNLRDDKVY